MSRPRRSPFRSPRATIATDDLASGAVTGAKLSVGSVDSSKIVDASIATAVLVDGGVTGAKLAAGAVTADKLGTGAVTGDKLGAGAVQQANLAVDSVDSSKIVDSSVGAQDLAGSAVTEPELANDALTASKLGAGTIAAEETLRIVRGNVDASATPTTPQIAAGSGFTVARVATGDFEITFDTPFLSTPTVTANCWNTAGGADIDNYIVVWEITPQSCRLVSRDDNGSVQDTSFSFIAIGPR